MIFRSDHKIMLSELTLCFPFRKIMSTALPRVIVWQQWRVEQITPCWSFRMERKHRYH